MADNVIANSGSGGSTFATDDIGGVHYPRSKLVWGADGTATDASAAAPLPVVQTGTPGLPTGASTAANQSTANTALSAIQTAVEALDNAIAGSEMQVDVVTLPALAAGSATIGAVNLAQYTPATGRLPVDPSGVTSPVSAASLPLPSGASTAAKQPSLGTAGTASTDVISIQGIASMTPLQVGDNSGSLTVDAPVGTPVFVRLSDGSSAIATLPVSLASVPSHAVTNAGTFPVQVDGAALTALQLIDDVVKVEDAVHGSGDSGVMALAVRRDANTTLADTTGDYAPLQVDASGSLKVAIISGAGSGGTSATDDAAFSVASGSGTPIMGFADETSPDLVDEGDVGVVRMTLYRGLHVNLRDASGAEVAVGGGTQYDEDTAHVTADKLTMAGVVRRDAAASGAGTDGDRSTLSHDANGLLWVNGSGVTQPMSVASLPLPSGASTSAAQTTGNNALAAIQTAVEILDNAIAGSEMQVDVVGALPAGTNNIGDVDVLSVVPGTAATSLGKAEDAAHTSGDVGVMALAVRVDTPGASAGTDGDYAPIQVNAAGAVRVDGSAVTQPVSLASVPSHAVTNAGTFAVQVDNTVTVASHAVTNAGTFAVQAALTAGTNTNEMVGDAAHDAAIAGNPVRTGGRALSADYTAVATGDTADFITDLNGKQIVMPYAIPENLVDGVTAAITGTSDTALIAAQGAGIRTYLTQITVTNSHATVGTVVEIKDNTTVRYRGYAAALGGGFTITLPAPLKGTANTAWNVANVTTGSNTYASASGYKAP